MWPFFSALLYVLAASLLGHIALWCASWVQSQWDFRGHTHPNQYQWTHSALEWPSIISAWLTGIFVVTRMEYRPVSRRSLIIATLVAPVCILLLTAVHITLYKYLFTHIPIISLMSEAMIRAGLMLCMVACIPLPGLPLFQTITLVISRQAYYTQHAYRHTLPILAICIFFLSFFLPIPVLDWTTLLSDAMFTAIYILS